MPEPISKPPGADAILAALAARHKPGDVVILAAIVEATGISPRKAGRVRRWAQSAGRWPYPDGRSQWPGWGHGGQRAMRRAGGS
jgi:hypothetical protein